MAQYHPDFVPEVKKDYHPDFIPDSIDDTNIQAVSENEPDTWMKGFINSVTSGDALSAGMQGLKGFVKGSFDFPSTLKGIGQSIASKFNEKDQPQLSEQELYDSIKQLHNTSKESFLDQAARNPEEFGHDLGMMTGQPLVTAGVFKAAPTATRLSGYPVELLGKGVKKYGVGMPRIFESRLQRGVERGVGSMIESVGKGMKRVGTIKQGELVTEDMPNVVNGEYTVKGPKQLPPSRTFHYGEQGLQEGEELTPKNYKVIRNETPNVNKPKFRTNGDGTFTNLETGEVLDSKGQSIVEINGKSTTSNIKPVPIKDVKQLINSIPKSGNIEFDSMLNKLQTLRKKAGIEGLNDLEFKEYENAANFVRHHPDMPLELELQWKELGRIAKERGPKFKIDDKVQIKEPSKATSKPTLVDKNSPFFTRNRPSHPMDIINNEKGVINLGNESIDLNSNFKHPTAQRWANIIKELDAVKAPDIKYRDIFSTGTKNALKKGETWRNRALKGIKYYESIVD